jgi:hypothetical protein
MMGLFGKKKEPEMLKVEGEAEVPKPPEQYKAKPEQKTVTLEQVLGEMLEQLHNSNDKLESIEEWEKQNGQNLLALNTKIELLNSVIQKAVEE